MSNGQGQEGNGRNQELSQGTLSPELVRRVTDRVYALWLMELRIERERRRPTMQNWRRK